jgi:hypothetical protein
VIDTHCFDVILHFIIVQKHSEKELLLFEREQTKKDIDMIQM